VGYLNIFDIGLGRALTKLAADKVAAGSNEEVSALFWTAFVLMLVLSLVGGAAMAAASSWLVYHALSIPTGLQAESLEALYLLSFSLPLVITMSAFRGMLSALLRFDLVNAVRIPLGISIFVSPLLVLPFSRSLVPAVGALLATRLLAWLAYLLVCLRYVPGLARYKRPSFETVRPLLSFGGWITVSSVIGPVMLYCDRFLIGAMLSTAAVAYYATACDLVLRLSVVPTAVAGVLFPAFARSLPQTTADRTVALFSRGSNLIFIVIFPSVLLMVVLAPEGLSLWLGHDFSEHSAVILQWLAAGIFVNSLAHLPFTIIQAAHRPDITAKLSLLELPLYLLLLYGLVHRKGLEGVAIAWSIRISVDSVVLWIAALNLVPRVREVASHNFQMLLAALAIIASGAILPRIIVLQVGFLALSLSGFALISWVFLLMPDDRQRISIGLRSFYRLPA
jgi:O-antigen/teichoic acid export membrane protein